LKRSERVVETPISEVNLLDATRSGEVTITAEGRGDGRMTLSVTNNTRRRLRVVLPPGIIARGATGQFGGVGGLGGGMGGGGRGGRGGGRGGGGEGGEGGWQGRDGRWHGWYGWYGWRRWYDGWNGWYGSNIGDDARHDGNDDAGANHHVFLRRPG